MPEDQSKEEQSRMNQLAGAQQKARKGQEFAELEQQLLSRVSDDENKELLEKLSAGVRGAFEEKGKAEQFKKGISLGIALRKAVKENDFSGLAFFIVLGLSVFKDSIDLIDLGSIIGPLLNVFVSMALIVFFLGRAGTYIKTFAIRRFLGAAIMEFIPYLSLFPFYTFMTLVLKRGLDKRKRKAIEKEEKHQAEMQELLGGLSRGKRSKGREGALRRASAGLRMPGGIGGGLGALRQGAAMPGKGLASLRSATSSARDIGRSVRPSMRDAASAPRQAVSSARGATKAVRDKMPSAKEVVSTPRQAISQTRAAGKSIASKAPSVRKMAASSRQAVSAAKGATKKVRDKLPSAKDITPTLGQFPKK